MDSSESSYLVNNDKPSSSYKRYNSDGTAADAVELAIDEFDEVSLS